MSLACLLVFGATGCGEISEEDGKKWAEENGYVKLEGPAALPAPVDTSIAKCDTDNTTVKYGADCSTIKASNLKDYMGREDVMYIDVRNATSETTAFYKEADGEYKKVETPTTGGGVTVTYEKIGEEEEYTGDRYNVYPQFDTGTYSGEHLKGFSNVEFFRYVYNEKGGQQLFYKGADGRFAPTYATSVETLEALFPKDKTLFIMCQSGGRVVTLMQILDQFGWDMSKVYNVGGMNHYQNSDLKVTTTHAYKYTVKTGSATGTVPGAGTNTTAVSLTVNVLLDETTYEIGGVYVKEGTPSSESFATNWSEGVEEILNSFVGLTVEEARAKVSNGALAGDADKIAGATVSTKLIYDAVIKALEGVVVE